MVGLRIGVIADDLTGATDVAEQVWRVGRTATVLVGVPDLAVAGADADVVVVALKNRSTPPEEAAAEAGAAAAALHRAGFGLLYQKYCSTFDSTAEGNIGPIGDAIAAAVEADAGRRVRRLGTPATPSVGRTVHLGHLFVHGELLERSSMARHPITPMTDSRLRELLRPQTERPVDLVTQSVVRAGEACLTEAVGAQPADAVLLFDADDEGDLDRIAGAVLVEIDAGRPVVAHGGAGLAAALARRAPRLPNPDRPAGGFRPTGRRLVLSGSLSDATRLQNERFTGERIPLDPSLTAAEDIARIVSELGRTYEEPGRDPDRPVLVTSAEASDAAAPPLGPEHVEDVLAGVARRAVDELCVGQLLVAGGETSGAVIRDLGVVELRMARSVEPGIAWCVAHRSTGPASLAILLKSGNFGRPDLFETAWGDHA